MIFSEWKEHCFSILEPVFGKRETQSVFRIWMQERLPKPFWEWTISPNRIIPADILSVIYDELNLLAKKYPVQYLPNCCTFLDYSWQVGLGVLIPRQETEELVLWALEFLKDKKNAKVLDVCTGSGCIPITLQLKNPEVKIWALDVSDEALSYAVKNQETYQTTVEFLKQDWFTFDTEQTYDLILSNPPYIPEFEWKSLDISVKEYEPSLALVVPDADPLKFYIDIIQKSRKMLNENGAVFFEIHENYALEIKNKAEKWGAKVEIKQDAFGKDRMIKLQWSELFNFPIQ